MCGIAGIVAPIEDSAAESRLDTMLRVQAHRGPDGHGKVVENVGRARVALGHGRLAIIDLSDGGAQPMYSRSRREVLIFNGEIYNYREIARELTENGVHLRTQSDTEVLLEALLLWGEAALTRFNGMWAFAFLQMNAKRLLLSRDRFGVKPLYTRLADGCVYFASEIKTILVGSGARLRPNVTAVDRYLRQGLLDAQDETFFDGITAVPAGHNQIVELPELPLTPKPPRPYWSIDRERPMTGSVASMIEEARETFRSAVALRLRSDVPVGVLLSGGVDSSAIAATMKQLVDNSQLHLISSVSDDPRYDESPHIDRMTEHLGCPAHKVKLSFSPDEAFRLLATVTYANDEPLGSFSYVAHYLLMEQARMLGVTVLLSGQGADEVLCGYRKYLGFHLQSLLRRGRVLEAAAVFGQFATNGTVLNQFRFDEAKRYLPSRVRRVEHDVRGPALRDAPPPLAVGLGPGTVQDRQRADLYRLSVPALVHYEDRMSMAFGREIRLPFLDYRFVSKVLPSSIDLKLRAGWTKWLLRKAIEPDLPAAITWRKDKQGFTNPQAVWFRRELRATIEGMLRETFVTAQLGLVDQLAVARQYQAFCQQPDDGGRLAFKDVFTPLALEIWARQFRDYLSGA